MISVQMHLKKKMIKPLSKFPLQRFSSLPKKCYDLNSFHVFCLTWTLPRLEPPMHSFVYLPPFQNACFVSNTPVPFQTKNPYALANCSLLHFPISKSLINNELYVDNFTVNIQHSRPVEENVEVEGDAWWEKAREGIQEGFSQWKVSLNSNNCKAKCKIRLPEVHFENETIRF